MKTMIAGIGIALLFAASPAAAADDDCAAYEARIAKITPLLTRTIGLIKASKLTEATALLPDLQSALDAEPAAMPPPLRCNGKLRVYDSHQYRAFQALVAAGQPVPGFPGMPIEPGSSAMVTLAYLVGEIQDANGHNDAAIAAFAKGLKIAPDDHGTMQSYMAILLSQRRFADMIALADAFLARDKDIDVKGRSMVMTAKAISQARTGDKAGALVTARAAALVDPANSEAKELVEDYSK